MNGSVRLLHITDTHFLESGNDYSPDDVKVDIGSGVQSREEALETLFKRVAARIGPAGFDGIVFSGDALARGEAGGNRRLLALILKYFHTDPNRILAVPGNHDVPKGSAPGSPCRYADFLSVWREAGCITPWLDGIDSAEPQAAWRRHVLIGKQYSWAILAVNTCNWSHTESVPEGLTDVWDRLAPAAAAGDPIREQRIARELKELVRHDAAHISRQQFERLRDMIEVLPQPPKGKQLRMVALHHHLRNPSHRLEFKSMPDLIPLEQFRTLLLQREIKVVFHGHKHEWRQHFDHVETLHDAGGTPHRVLMLAGGTFSDTSNSHAAASVEINGLPWAPSVQVDTFAIPGPGLDLECNIGSPLRLWDYTEGADLSHRQMTVIQGSDINEVYAKVRASVSSFQSPEPLVVQIDLGVEGAWRLPDGYPTPVPEQRRDGWLKGLVQWWQRRDSQLERRVRYIHGNRLLKYGNNIDQIERIIKLLRAQNTSRALAVLVDPRLDFGEDPKTEFASFCLVQFLRREKAGGHLIDVIGYYRAQEMLHWWPINVAELRYLQEKVIQGGAGGQPGRITTITASARLDTAPSPTHVAMPLIDRWLDQSPEKFFKLATYMLNGQPEANDTLVQEWLDELAALQTSVQRPAHDGGPVVAIDGLDRLAVYLTACSGPNSERCQELASVLDTLARHAENRPATRDGLSTWERTMQNHLERAIRLSQEALGLSAT